MNSADRFDVAQAWPHCPPGVRFAFTTRQGGVSRPPCDALNLGLHVDDDPEAVAENRQRVLDTLGIGAPAWLRQVHGTAVVLNPSAGGSPPVADAAWTDRQVMPLAVLTADCLPVLMATRDGAEIGVAHAGWRGLADGVLEQLVSAFRQPPEALSVCLGPAIGPQAFEVGPEVRAAFTAVRRETAAAFRPGKDDRWMADLYQLARLALSGAGVEVSRISGGRYCTYRQADDFFSYRRDGRTGRMASLIWIETGDYTVNSACDPS